MLKRTDRGGAALAITAIVLITVVIAGGCKDSANEAGSTQAREASKPRFETLVIPAGTHIVASLETRLSTETNHTGDSFVATTTEPVVINEKTVAPSGTKIRGNLRDVQASGRVKGRARMLAYEEIVDSAGNAHAISAQLLTLRRLRPTASEDCGGASSGKVIGGLRAAVRARDRRGQSRRRHGATLVTEVTRWS
jgi:hypothetical protein